MEIPVKADADYAKENSKPLCYGEVVNVTPVAVNTDNFIFQTQEKTVSAIKDEHKRYSLMDQLIGKNPKEVPVAMLREAMGTPYDFSDATETRVRDSLARKPTPRKAIRATCLMCTGYSQKEVTLCTAVTCPLWSFRLGTNPFYKQNPDRKPPSFLSKSKDNAELEGADLDNDLDDDLDDEDSDVTDDFVIEEPLPVVAD